MFLIQCLLQKHAKMNKIVLLVHGGAGPDSKFIKENIAAYNEGLEEALNAGYTILEAGGSALDAVEAAVNYLEDNEIFNAGRGSALNEKAEVEMDASIMNGKDQSLGAVAIVKNVKNPVTLARAVMEKSKHTYMGGAGAKAFAESINLEMRPEEYFITDHALEQLQEAKEENGEELEVAGIKQRSHGTVGAVALDKDGNLAAATSTGGIENKMEGRIADSSMTGIGSYANNKTCAVSGTGDGEYLMQNVMAFHISALMEYKGLPLKEACSYLMHEKLKDVKGDMGIIALDAKGNFAMEYNSARMHRGWKTSDGEHGVKIYE
ncbi:MAG: asparaginase [Segetibacter sp.]|nr:asparaginase [Segetibacter sp.]